jgi:hypothetical protein
MSVSVVEMQVAGVRGQCHVVRGMGGLVDGRRAIAGCDCDIDGRAVSAVAQADGLLGSLSSAKSANGLLMCVTH